MRLQFANTINGMNRNQRWAARPSGMAWTQAKVNGALWRGTGSTPGVIPEVEAYGFVTIDIADAIIATA